MQSLTWIGLVAMFLVGGGMLSHNLEWLHHLSMNLTNGFNQGLAQTALAMFLDSVYGIIAGLIVAGVIHIIPKRQQPEI